MALHKVIADRINRLVDGNLLSHVKGEIVDLAEAEAKRFFRLRAAAPVDDDGNVTAIPEAPKASPHLDADVETASGGAPVTPEPVEEEPVAVEDVPVPRGNASLDEWAAYAKACGATDADLDGLGQRQIRDKYGPTAQNGEQ